MLFFRKKVNDNSYTIRETLLLSENSVAKYVAIICSHDSFFVSLVLLDSNMKTLNTIMEL